MIEGKGYISDFDNKAKQISENNHNGGPINFSIAHKIEGNTGSTCDTYITSYHESRVFIKKLKAKFIDKVLYRKALEKEFDLGYRLKHPSLPIYKEFHGDYIIMEFIEGETIAELIKKKDIWLQKDRNVRKILKQLIEVIDYLHQNGISHCDIKSDNILITKGHRNVVLIDLDKCFTSSKDNTPGASSLYNVDSNRIGHPDVDFHGVGLLVRKLGSEIPGFPVKSFASFTKLCNQEDIDAESLLDWLQNYTTSNKRYPKKKQTSSWLDFLPFLIPFLILAGLGIFLTINNDEKEAEPSYPRSDSTLIEAPIEAVRTEGSIDHNVSETELEEISGENTKNRIYERGYKKEIEEGMKNHVIPIQNILQEVSQILKDSVSDKELNEWIYRMVSVQNDVFQDASKHFEEKYPTVEPLDIQLAISKATAYKMVSKEIEDITKKIADIISTRHSEIYKNPD